MTAAIVLATFAVSDAGVIAAAAGILWASGLTLPRRGQA